MAVVLTISETVTGANVSDSLAGGSTGLDFGQVTNGQYAPLISQAANTGHQTFSSDTMLSSIPLPT